MLNFVLCFDQNYNNVAHLFLHTLFSKVDEKVNIHIIHDEPSTFKNTLNILEEYKNPKKELKMIFEKDPTKESKDKNK